MKEIIKEFKEFVSKGNVVDLAVGLIVGGVFGKVVTSLVEDVLMPPIGMIIGGINFTDLKIVLTEGVSINYGNFFQSIVNFLITAFAIFGVVKLMNKLKKQQQRVEEPVKSPEELLLEEIRDLLKRK